MTTDHHQNPTVTTYATNPANVPAHFPVPEQDSSDHQPGDAVKVDDHA